MFHQHTLQASSNDERSFDFYTWRILMAGSKTLKQSRPYYLLAPTGENTYFWGF